MKIKESRPYLGFLKEYAFKKKLLPSYILTIGDYCANGGGFFDTPGATGKSDR